MNVVIDTSVLLKMAMSGMKLPLFVAWRVRQYDLVLSEPILRELEGVLARPKIKRFIRPSVVTRFLTDLRDGAIFVEPASDYPYCRDPKDDVVIATAVAAQANYLITADKDLYDDPDLVEDMKNLGVHILSPALFLKQLPD